MTTLQGAFDRDFALAELLAGLPRPRLEATLARALGEHWQLVDAEGVLQWGQGGVLSDAIAVAVRIELEPIGRLQAAGATRAAVETAAAWLEMLLVSHHRYRMAADLHLEAVDADYQALQRKHEALQQSEARYRELYGQLDRRVQEQVGVIERTQRRLYQAEKMAAVGSLAAGMAHEINNPIGFIRSNLTTADGYLKKIQRVLDAARQGDARETEARWNALDLDFVLDDFGGLLAESVNGADRIAHIVANLKAFASIDVGVQAPVDLNECVRAVVGVVQGQLPPDVALTVDTQPLPRIPCDQSRINQVLFALVQNARQALDGAGTIHIATRVAGNEIRVSVSDSGRGIAPEMLNRIFDPFFTTRDVGKGTGLGLTVSRDVVEAHQGHIEVESTVGKGSTFTVCLPLAPARPRPELREPSA